MRTNPEWENLKELLYEAQSDEDRLETFRACKDFRKLNSEELFWSMLEEEMEELSNSIRVDKESTAIDNAMEYHD